MMGAGYKGGNAGFCDVPKSQGVLERPGPETDREICGGIAACPEWCIFRPGFACRMAVC